MNVLEDSEIDAFVAAALAEDVGSGDVTSASVVPEEARLSAAMTAREAMNVAGLLIAGRVFRACDADAEIDIHFGEGGRARAGDVLMSVSGRARALLTAERTALNIVQHLSGIATLTRQYVEAIEGTGATLLDTRKTIPLLRRLEKYATRMGGAKNHRMGLHDAILIKDNHIAMTGGVAEAVAAAKAASQLPVEVECDTLDQVEDALAAGADSILCDNMKTAELSAAVALARGRVTIEASGGVTLKTIRPIAETGVDYISVGRITQSAPAVDIGLDYTGA